MGRPAKPHHNPYPVIPALNDTHKRIAQMQCAGMKNKDIARIVGISPSLISSLQKSDLYHAYKQQIHSANETLISAIRERQSLLCAKALDVAEEIMLDETEKSSTRLRAAQSILAGQGLQGREKQGGSHIEQVNIQLNSQTPDDARDVIARFMQNFKEKAA